MPLRMTFVTISHMVLYTHGKWLLLFDIDCRLFRW